MIKFQHRDRISDKLLILNIYFISSSSIYFGIYLNRSSISAKPNAYESSTCIQQDIEKIKYNYLNNF